MKFDTPQDSHTLMQDARGPADTLGFFNETAVQVHDTSPATIEFERVGDPRQRPFRRQLRPRIAADLVSRALTILDPLPATDAADHGSEPDAAGLDLSDADTMDAVNGLAGHLTAVSNAARMATRATYRRGELAALRRVIEDLPDDYTDAVDAVEAYATRLADELTGMRRDLEPAIVALNEPQRSPTSFELTPADDAMRGVWAGRQHWINLAEDTVETARDQGRTIGATPHNVRALITALADFFDSAGHGCTAATATIVARARDRHGATIAESTGARRLRTVTAILTDAGLLLRQATGRHLRSIERIAARNHHGGTQKAVANYLDANVPAWLLPDPCPAPDGPAYSDGLDARLAARDAADTARIAENHAPAVNCTDSQPSTYTGGYGVEFPSCKNWVAHKRAQARASTENPSSMTQNEPQGARRAPISLRARRIADDLTRTNPDNSRASGPYAALCGPQSHQIGLTHLARLIDAHTPSWAGTRDVMAGLVHAATSDATGYVALGLRDPADNATAWMTRVLSSIDWDTADDFPAWWRVAAAYNLRWEGSRMALGDAPKWNSIG